MPPWGRSSENRQRPVTVQEIVLSLFANSTQAAGIFWEQQPCFLLPSQLYSWPPPPSSSSFSMIHRYYAFEQALCYSHCHSIPQTTILMTMNAHTFDTGMCALSLMMSFSGTFTATVVLKTEHRTLQVWSLTVICPSGCVPSLSMLMWFVYVASLQRQ